MAFSIKVDGQTHSVDVDGERRPFECCECNSFETQGEYHGTKDWSREAQ